MAGYTWFALFIIFDKRVVPKKYAGRQEVGASGQIVFHVQVVVAELRPDQFGRGKYAHPAGVRRAGVSRRPSNQLFSRVEVRRAVGRPLAQASAYGLRVTGHVRAVPADAQVPRAPGPLLAVASAEAQPENRFGHRRSLKCIILTYINMET